MNRLEALVAVAALCESQREVVMADPPTRDDIAVAIGAGLVSEQVEALALRWVERNDSLRARVDAGGAEH